MAENFHGIGEIAEMIGFRVADRPHSAPTSAPDSRVKPIHLAVVNAGRLRVGILRTDRLWQQRPMDAVGRCSSVHPPGLFLPIEPLPDHFVLFRGAGSRVNEDVREGKAADLWAGDENVVVLAASVFHEPQIGLGPMEAVGRFGATEAIIIVALLIVIEVAVPQTPTVALADYGPARDGRILPRFVGPQQRLRGAIADMKDRRGRRLVGRG